MQLRYPWPIAEILSNLNTHRKPWTQTLMWAIHGHDSFENSKGEKEKCCPPLPQALSIKADITLGIPQSYPIDWKWQCVGLERPLAGKSVSNPALESNLPTKVNFHSERATRNRNRPGSNNGLNSDVLHWELYIEHKLRPWVYVVSSERQNWGHVVRSHAYHENNVLVTNKPLNKHARSQLRCWWHVDHDKFQLREDNETCIHHELGRQDQICSLASKPVFSHHRRIFSWQHQISSVNKARPRLNNNGDEINITEST